MRLASTYKHPLSRESGEGREATEGTEMFFVAFVFRRGVEQRKPFLATTRKTRVIGLQRNLIAPPGTILIFVFTFFCKIS